MNVKESYSNDVQLIAEIILAIETKNDIQFVYAKEIETTMTRKCSPYNLYWNSDNTKVLLDAFQISGESQSGKLESFKQFDIRFIQDVIILDSQFEINEKYNPISRRYENSILGVIE